MTSEMSYVTLERVIEGIPQIKVFTSEVILWYSHFHYNDDSIVIRMMVL